LRQLDDRRYRELLVEQAWMKDERRCLEMLRRHRILFVTGTGAGVDFFARLLLRQLAEGTDAAPVRGIQFASCEAFLAYRPERVLRAGFILRHILDHFLVPGRAEEMEAFSNLVRGPALGECLRRLATNKSYLIFTCSHGQDLKQFEEKAGMGNSEVAFLDLQVALASVDPPVVLAHVFHVLKNKGSQIAQALNTYWGSDCALRHSSTAHVRARVRPRFSMRGSK
jgi:hypothetical protein